MVIQCAARITRHRAISLSPRGRPARRFDPQMGSDFESLGINFEARAVILEAWRLIFRISEMDVCFYRKKCLRGPPSKAHSNPFFTVLWFDGFLEFCMWWIFVIFSAQRFHSGVHVRAFLEALGLFNNRWTCVTIVIFRGLTPFGRRLFPGLDRECVLTLSFYRNLRFWGVGGSQFRTLLVLIVVKSRGA